MNMLQVIQGGAYGKMSDDQLDNERGAQNRLFRAINEMREAVNMVNRCSAVVKIDPAAFLNFVHDELPSEDFWEEKIAGMRS